jgi:Family of unknown function (DUF6328)
VAARGSPRRDETEEERLDRELIELLNELRVVLPGVQVLFAFLLTVPFAQRFDRLTELQRDLFFATLLCTALCTALLIAPSSYHRLRFRAGDKKRMLATSNRLTIAGIGTLALAMSGAILLIADLLFSRTTAVVTASAAAAVFAGVWFALPLTRHLADEGSRPE